MQLPIVGPSYEHASQDVNAQKCINLFLSDAGPGGRTPAVLLPTAGLYELGDCTGTEVRALMVHGTHLYALVNSTVYSLTWNASALTLTPSSIGTISTSSTGPISWAINPTQIMFVDGTATGGWIITVATDTLAQIVDVDFTGGKTVTFMDSYFIYNTPSSTTMFATALNDGSSMAALDFATAEGHPDNIVALATDKRELWVFGEKSVEIWYDAANATGFPFSRREGAFIDYGCGAAHSVVKFDNSLVWLDNRGFIVRSEGYTPKVISTEAVSKAIRGYTTTSDALAFEHIDRGHIFYVITFPTEGKTWSYDATTEQWHERNYTTPTTGVATRHLANCHLRYQQYDFVGAYNSGKLYLLSNDYYDDDGDAIHRIRVTPHINAEFNLIGIDSLELLMESGKALATGTGSDPQIMMRYSHDGGYTWSNELARSIGKIGEYDKSIRWNRLGIGREWVFEFRITDPFAFSIIDASIMTSGGKG